MEALFERYMNDTGAVLDITEESFQALKQSVADSTAEAEFKAEFARMPREDFVTLFKQAIMGNLNARIFRDPACIVDIDEQEFKIYRACMLDDFGQDPYFVNMTRESFVAGAKAIMGQTT